MLEIRHWKLWGQCEIFRWELQRQLEAREGGAARAGRSVDDLDRPQLVVCSVADTREEALDGARLMVTQYLGQQPHIMKASGVPESLLEEIGRVLTWPATHDQVEAASRLVPDDIVQMICAAGTPDEVREKVGQYMADGCTCPILYPLGPDVHKMVDVFADWTPCSDDPTRRTRRPLPGRPRRRGRREHGHRHGRGAAR